VFRIQGLVISSQVVSYTDKHGQPATVCRFKVIDPERPDYPVSASCPAELAPDVAAFVDFRVAIRPMSSDKGPWLSIWVLANEPVPAGA